MDVDEDYESARLSPALVDSAPIPSGSDRKLYPNESKHLPLSQAELADRQRRQDRHSRFGADVAAVSRSDLEAPSAKPLSSHTELRLDAVYLTSPIIGQLDTKKIMGWANTHVMAAMTEGIEWVDDNSVVLVFSTPSAAITALSALALDPQEVSALRDAMLRASDIYSAPATTDLSVIGSYVPSKAILDNEDATQSIGWMRMAHITDQKQKGARDVSQFYAKRIQARGSRPHDNSRVQDEMNALDAELAAFVGDDYHTSARRKRQRTSPKPTRDRELDELDRQLDNMYDAREDETATNRRPRERRKRSRDIDALDRELDNYTTGSVAQIDILETVKPGVLRADLIADERPLATRLSWPARRDRQRGRTSDEAEVATVDDHNHKRPKQIERLAMSSIEAKDAIHGLRGWTATRASPQVDLLAGGSQGSKQIKVVDLFEQAISDVVPKKRGAMYGWDD